MRPEYLRNTFAKRRAGTSLVLRQQGVYSFYPWNFPLEERRQIMQLVDAFIERGQLKRRSNQTASG